MIILKHCIQAGKSAIMKADSIEPATAQEDPADPEAQAVRKALDKCQELLCLDKMLQAGTVVQRVQ